MTEPQGQTPAAGQPATATPSQGAPDPAAAGGMLQGGITPQVEAVLARLPPTDADVVRADIAQRNAHLTKSQRTLERQRQELEMDVRQAATMRELVQDPDFREYVEARERGDLPTYFRQRAERLSGSAANGSHPDKLSPAGEPPVNGNGARQAQPDPTLRRIETLEQRIAREEAGRQIAAFQADPRFADHAELMPAMRAARARLGPNAIVTLPDLYFLAKGMVESGEVAKATPAAPAATAGSAPAAAGTPVVVTQVASSASPPPAVGGRPSATTPGTAKSGSMRDAFRRSKEQLGLPSEPVVFQSFGGGN